MAEKRLTKEIVPLPVSGANRFSRGPFSSGAVSMGLD
jgi:hypothetical protein